MSRARIAGELLPGVDSPEWKELGRHIRRALADYRVGLPASTHAALVRALDAAESVRQIAWARTTTPPPEPTS